MKKLKPCSTWTIFYSIGNEARVFRMVVKGHRTPKAALKCLEDLQGPVNHALVYVGEFPEPRLATF